MLLRRWLPVVIAAVVASSATADGPPTAPNADVHFVSPGAGYTRYYDPLMAETAVRLAALGLQAEHEAAVRCWPAHRAQQAADKHPRIELRPSGWPSMSILRLTRRGDTFIFSAGREDGEFLEIGRARMDLPRRARVGVMVFSYYDGHAVGAIVQDLRLNGQPLTDTRTTNLGGPVDSFHAEWNDDGRLELRSMGHWTGADRHPYGPLVHKQVEGDFTFEGRLHTFTHVPKWRYWGLCALDGTRPDARIVGVFSDGEGLYGGVQRAGAKRLLWTWDGERHFIRAYLLDGKGEPEQLARRWVCPATWAQLVDSVTDISRPMRERAAEICGLSGLPPAGPVPATSDQLTALDRARHLALRLRGDQVLSAARWTGDVLSESPTCPEAHYTAAMCGAMLALREPYGCFHDRGRLLARPLAHLLIARRLAEPDRPQDRLAEAWVMLACGYPDAALRAVDGLDASAAPSELRALRMFATRDGRGLDADRLGGVSPLERAAWAFAAGQRETEALDEQLLKLARLEASPAGLPALRLTDGDRQDAFSRAGLSLTAGRTVADLLTCEDIPKLDRCAAAEHIASAMGVEPAGGLAETANRLSASLAHDGLTDEATPRVLAAVLELCTAAEQAAPERRAWPVVTPAEYAAQQRGLLLTWLYRRAERLSRDREHRLAAKDYCNAVAESLEAVDGAADYFRAFGAAGLGEVYRTRACLRRAFDSPLGRDIPAMHFVSVEWPGDLWRRLSEDAPYQFGRGAWELTLQADALGALGSEGRRFAVRCQQMRIDAHATPAAHRSVASSP
jgi:hypothetical protein